MLCWLVCCCFCFYLLHCYRTTCKDLDQGDSIIRWRVRARCNRQAVDCGLDGLHWVMTILNGAATTHNTPLPWSCMLAPMNISLQKHMKIHVWCTHENTCVWCNAKSNCNIWASIRLNSESSWAWIITVDYAMITSDVYILIGFNP